MYGRGHVARIAVGNVERNDPSFAVVGAFEPLSGVDEFGVAEADGEVEDGSVGDRDPWRSSACLRTVLRSCWS